MLPIGAVFGILSWLSCPLVILLAYAPWVAGTLNLSLIHIYVYKRQVFFDTIATFIQNIAGLTILAGKNVAQVSNGISNPVVAGIISVSYTHLRMYEEENNAYCFFGANNCCFICVVLF